MKNLSRNILVSLIITGLFYLHVALASDHKYEKAKSPPNETHEEHDDHGHDHSGEGGERKEKRGKKDAHSHEASEMGHEEEGEAKNVGPNKGIISYDEHDGFVLSSGASKNFKIEYLTLQNSAPWILPKSALVTTREDRSVYRNRGGKLLRVDVTLVSRTKDHAQVKSEDLQPGDQIVIRGAEFLRVAELDITSGESGHHH